MRVVMAVKSVSYIGRVWDKVILTKYLTMFNSGYHASKIFQNHMSTKKQTKTRWEYAHIYIAWFMETTV